MTTKRKKIPLLESLSMLYGYAKSRIAEQIKLVAFIIIYLSAFQTLILNVKITSALSMSGGIAMVIVGLAFFLEGLILGLMPMGERVGLKLPAKVGIAIIALFGLLLGFGSTLAEPAMSALRTAGSKVTAWDAPLLYMLLERYTEPLVLSIGVGVGIAVAFGMFRFYYGLSLKPFIYIIIPILLVMSVILHFDVNLGTVIGLAWDSGAVTTGAVTVPLVLALGIGVSRAAGKSESASGGFGIIMLASAFPIISVLTYSIILNTKAPQPTTEIAFFSPENRQKALLLFNSEQELAKHAFTHGTEAGRRAFFIDENLYHNALISLKENPEMTRSYLGKLSLTDWLSNRASVAEWEFLSSIHTELAEETKDVPVTTVLKEEGSIALRAVIPLSALLLLVLLLFLRHRLRYSDEVILGISFALIGMTLLTSGIRLGLAPLGDQVGSHLPVAFQSEEKFVDRILLENFETDLLVRSIGTDGTQKIYFYLQDKDAIERVEFRPEQYDEETKRYEHIITQPPMFKANLTLIGIVLVFLFAFGMGFGSTLAEPALNALGKTVEDLTVGTVKRTQILQVVSIGVGLGLMAGVARILYDIPTIWLILPPYLLLIPLTYLSEENFTAIAWDCGGVTTGPVTVPLVLAMGIGIGNELNVIDGFGVLALASVFPILTVLLFGLIMKYRQRQSISQTIDQ